MTCTTGAALALGAPLREDQLVERACDAHTNSVTQDVFGCGGLLDAQNVRFDTDLGSGDGVKIRWDASDDVIVIGR